LTAFRLGDLAARIGGTVVGDASRQVANVAQPGEASADSIVLAAEPQVLRTVEAGPSAALLVPKGVVPRGKPAIQAGNVRLAFARLLECFAPPREETPGVHPTAVLGKSVVVGKDAAVGPHVVIGDDTVLGARSVVRAGAVIGREVVVGEACLIYENVTIRDGTRLGDRVIIHPGTVIGSDGFGYAESDEGPTKIPHLGRVVIEDDVEIGANTTIDRGTLGETRIGRGTKIDNLVQVAHNVRIGRAVMIVGQVGVSGSVTIGDGAILAGQAGVPDHLSVGPRARLLARAVPTKDVPPGETVSGFPAQPHRDELRQLAALRRLPEALQRLARIEERLSGVEGGRDEEGRDEEGRKPRKGRTDAK
jgi:UDP-3-O-[3-hydroxymyristoyl] glucosamine N-acyltransferase